MKTEDDPLYRDAPAVFHDIFGAVIELETVALAATALKPVVLRYGNFYGPGTRFAADGSDAELVRRGRFPIAGEGSAHWSFIHVEDAAQATLLALEDAEPGVYNVVDDEPAAVRDWLPVYAAALGAPRRPTRSRHAATMAPKACCSRAAPRTQRRRRGSAGRRSTHPGERDSSAGSPDAARPGEKQSLAA